MHACVESRGQAVGVRSLLTTWVLRIELKLLGLSSRVLPLCSLAREERDLWNGSQEIFNKYMYQKIRFRYKTTVKAFIAHSGKKGEMSIFEHPVCACITDRLVWEESQVHFIPFEIAVLFQDSLLRRKIKTLHTNCQSRYSNIACSHEEWSLKLNGRERNKWR